MDILQFIDVTEYMTFIEADYTLQFIDISESFEFIEV